LFGKDRYQTPLLRVFADETKGTNERPRLIQRANRNRIGAEPFERTTRHAVGDPVPSLGRPYCVSLVDRALRDPAAEFVYVPADEVMGYAARTGAIPYDVPRVELGHHGPECSFDAILKKYALTDPALQRLARIVRGTDTPAKDLTPESPGLEAIADGFRRLFDDDHAQLAAERIVYDALYAFCQAQEDGA
jgi:hypothetical protein